MPKRREFNFVVTHILADGRVLSDEEFNELEIDPAKNEEVLHEIAMAIDPSYAAVHRIQRRRESVRARREKLRLERERIDKELNSL